MMKPSLRAAAVAFAIGLGLVALVACGARDRASPYGPGTDLFSDDPDGGGSIARTFECTSRNEDGSCNVNECKQGPGGATFDCASFANACVEAGHHWSGTREGGKCTRVL